MVSCLEDWNFKQRFESEGLPSNLGGSGIDPFPQWMNPINPLSSIIPLQNRFIKTFKPDTDFLTTNLPFAQWGNLFDSTTVATAIADRLVMNSEVIILEGESYRRNKRKK